MSKPIVIAASLKIEAAEANSPPKFEVLAYNGGSLEVAGYPSPVVVDLSGLEPSSNLVANLDHDRTRRVGHVSAMTNDGKQLTLSGIISAATESAREVVESSKNGFVWQASIEASPSKLVQVEANATHDVNGRTIKGPVIIATSSKLLGFAFVSHGADSDTKVAIAAEVHEDFHGLLADAGLSGCTDLDQLAAVHASCRGCPGEPSPEDYSAVRGAYPLVAAAFDSMDSELLRCQRIEKIVSGEWGDLQPQVNDLHRRGIAGELSHDQLIQAMREVRAKQRRDGCGRYQHAIRQSVFGLGSIGRFGLVGRFRLARKRVEYQVVFVQKSADRSRDDRRFFGRPRNAVYRKCGKRF